MFHIVAIAVPQGMSNPLDITKVVQQQAYSLLLYNDVLKITYPLLHLQRLKYFYLANKKECNFTVAENPDGTIVLNLNAGTVDSLPATQVDTGIRLNNYRFVVLYKERDLVHKEELCYYNLYDIANRMEVTYTATDLIRLIEQSDANKVSNLCVKRRERPYLSSIKGTFPEFIHNDDTADKQKSESNTSDLLRLSLKELNSTDKVLNAPINAVNFKLNLSDKAVIKRLISVEELQIPAATQYIDKETLNCMPNLMRIVVSKSNKKFTSRGNLLFKDKALYFVVPEPAKVIQISGIQVIKPRTFSIASDFVAVELINVKQIDKQAFRGATIEHLIFNGDLPHLEDGCLCGIKDLNTISLLGTYTQNQLARLFDLGIWVCLQDIEDTADPLKNCNRTFNIKCYDKQTYNILTVDFEIDRKRVEYCGK